MLLGKQRNSSSFKFHTKQVFNLEKKKLCLFTPTSALSLVSVTVTHSPRQGPDWWPPTLALWIQILLFLAFHWSLSKSFSNVNLLTEDCTLPLLTWALLYLLKISKHFAYVNARGLVLNKDPDPKDHNHYQNKLSLQNTATFYNISRKNQRTKYKNEQAQNY